MGKKRTAKKTARGQGVNKSAAIRDFLSDSPSAGPKEVQTNLAKRGIDVSEALVSNVKYNLSLKKGRKKKRARGRTANSKPMEDIRQAGDLMMQAVDLVVKAGAKEASQLVDMAVSMVKKVSNGN